MDAASAAQTDNRPIFGSIPSSEAPALGRACISGERGGMTGAEQRPWYVARAKSHDGLDAVDRARAAGFDAHYPRQAVRRQGRDEINAPVFPGYVLVSWAPGQDWGALLRHPVGLLSLLTTTMGDPIRLRFPDGRSVDDFMAAANSEGVFPHWWPQERPPQASDKLGKRFQVQSGAWTQFIGQCVSANKNRASLLMSLFGRQTVVEFRADQLAEV